jgi:Ca-activated chloride channel family protein
MNDVRWANLDAWVWGLVVVALILGFLWLAFWRHRRLSFLGRQGSLADQLDSRGGSLLAVRAILVVLAASFMVAGLMRPQHGTKATELKHLGIDIVIALDASKSMKAGDVVPDRLQASVLEIRRLLANLHGGRVGLVPFAGLAFVQTPLTSDTQVVETYLDELRVGDMPRGGTALGRAIIEGIRVLMPRELLEGSQAEAPRTEADASQRAAKEFVGAKHKALVVFTDGEDHEGDPVAAAVLAQEFGIRVFTVGVGTAQGRPVPIVNPEGEVTGTMKEADGRTPLFSNLGEGLLRQVAATTGGEYFHLGPMGMGDGLLQALDRLEKREYEATFRKLRDDRFQLATVPALVLLILEGLLAGRRRRRRKP